MLVQEVIRLKRDGGVLREEDIAHFVRGLVEESWSDAEVAALAMAIFLRGLTPAETMQLTRAMTHSGKVLDWRALGLPGPVMDKHSTGGVGDKVSLALAPIVAACGGFVPMIAGRGLGHTGGTLDKLEAIPGYRVQVTNAELRAVVREAGCAIVGASPGLAPADRRLYALRHVTATIESLPLITASILSKKLAAGLDALVLDVKTGDGAFARTHEEAARLARMLVDVANGAGLATTARITDMDQVLGGTCGNALEVEEALQLLGGHRPDERLLEVVRTLAADLLVQGRLARTQLDALLRVDRAIEDGRALERFARMVAALGGPPGFVDRPERFLPRAASRLPVAAPRPGYVVRQQVRDIGLVVLELGGGRRRAADAIDAAVGLSEVVAVGTRVERGQPLALVHAPDAASGQAACERLAGMFVLADAAPHAPAPVVRERVVPR